MENFESIRGGDLTISKGLYIKSKAGSIKGLFFYLKMEVLQK